jgi:peptide/nickel transport system substrate-binding protein
MGGAGVLDAGRTVGVRLATAAVAVAVCMILSTAAAQAVQRGGSVTVLAAGDVDYLDPGETYYTFGFEVQMAVHRTLYTYVPGSREPVPDLAIGSPEIAGDARSLTVHLRSGVRFAPPVNREVVAADVKYAIERAFSASVSNGYAYAWFGDIVGAPARPPRVPTAISGIEVPDDHTLVLRLREPRASLVAAALVMPITAPVPREYAAPFDQQLPSTYDAHTVATGPYQVASRQAGSSLRLVRNPNWDAATDVRPAYLDEIDIDERNPNLTKSTRRVLTGARLLTGDTGVGTVELGALRRTRASQIATVSSGGTRYVALNTRVAPFTNRNVRRAVLAGFDRVRLRATRGGAAGGAIATHFLPPGVTGFKQAGGNAGTRAPFLAHPSGSRKLMRAYFRKAGYRSGRYTGRRSLLMVGTSQSPGRATAVEAARQLRSMGFRIRLKLVSQYSLYTDWCGVPARRVAICRNVGWFQDFDDPESLLRPTFDGTMISSFANVNWPQLDDRGINAAMESAGLLPPGARRLAAWASIDRRIVADAPAVPWLWDVVSHARSADLDGALSPYTTGWDLSFTGLRG